MQEINQQNLRLLIPGKAAGVAGLISKNTGMPLKEALLLFYRSSLYKQLEREETKVWHYSPLTIYHIWNTEQETGEIMWPEEGGMA